MSDLNLKGKRVALAGDFRAISRSDAVKGLEAAGITVGDISKRSAALFAGRGAGSKLTQAESFGVPVYTEAQLLSLLGLDAEAGESVAVSAISGPLADFRERFKAMVAELRRHPDVVILHYSVPPPASALTLETVRRALGGLDPAIENLYRQCDGCKLLWAYKHNPAFAKVTKLAREHNVARSFDRHFVCDVLTSRADGVIDLVPMSRLADADFEKGRLFTDDMTGELLEFRRGLRILNWSYFFNPTALQVKDGGLNAKVLRGDDHGAEFRGPGQPFETYINGLLASYGSVLCSSASWGSLDAVLLEHRTER